MMASASSASSPIGGSRIAVIGAGIVGVSCAIYLQRKGFDLVLLDADEPGRKTSYGNAGVISAGAMIPTATPRILSNLHKFALNRSSAVRFAPGYLLRNSGWLLRFLSGARAGKSRQAAIDLSSMTLASRPEHIALMQEAGISHRLRDTGWLKLYRSPAAMAHGSFDSDLFAYFGVAAAMLSAAEIADLEPSIKPIFAGGLHIKDAHSVDSPGEVTAAYARLFVSQGGELRQARVKEVIPRERGYDLTLDEGSLHVDKVVIAAGAWSADLLRPLGYRFPLAYERGYHLHFRGAEGASLARPINDVEAGYALAPMERGFRVTSGIELAERDAPPTPIQLAKVVPRAREAFPITAQADNEPWCGSRPSLPDCKPVIGEAPRHRGLWLAFGHGHIGFGTGPITGRTIAELVAGEKPGIDIGGLDPRRFG